MSSTSFLPPLNQVTREIIAVMVATVVVAWVISKSPQLRELVRGNSIPSPLDP